MRRGISSRWRVKGFIPPAPLPSAAATILRRPPPSYFAFFSFDHPSTTWTSKQHIYSIRSIRPDPVCALSRARIYYRFVPAGARENTTKWKGNGDKGERTRERKREKARERSQAGLVVIGSFVRRHPKHAGPWFSASTSNRAHIYPKRYLPRRPSSKRQRHEFSQPLEVRKFMTPFAFVLSVLLVALLRCRLLPFLPFVDGLLSAQLRRLSHEESLVEMSFVNINSVTAKCRFFWINFNWQQPIVDLCSNKWKNI